MGEGEKNPFFETLFLKKKGRCSCHIFFTDSTAAASGNINNSNIKTFLPVLNRALEGSAVLQKHCRPASVPQKVKPLDTHSYEISSRKKPFLCVCALYYYDTDLLARIQRHGSPRVDIVIRHCAIRLKGIRVAANEGPAGTF